MASIVLLYVYNLYCLSLSPRAARCVMVRLQLTYNLHNFVFHLCDDVQRHGSSSLHAMWSLESSLGELTRSVKGNRGVSNQILSSD